MSNLVRSYLIPVNASDAEALELINVIREDFQLDEGSNTVAPTTIAQAVQQPVQATSGSAAVDAAGIPHNPAIHSETPTLTDKGMWRARRGADKNAVSKYQNDHAARLAAGGANAAPAPAQNAVTGGVSLPPLGGPSAPSLPPLPGQNVRTKYNDLADFIVANSAPVGRLNNEWLAAFWTANGVNGLGDLAGNPERAGELLDALKGVLGQ